MRKKIKLYRALRTKYESWTPSVEAEYKKFLTKILLTQNHQGLVWKDDFDIFAKNLNWLMRKRRAFFADHIGLTQRYTKNGYASFLMIEVPIEDIFKHFHVEFQNFPQRKKQLEMVYSISTKVLEKNKNNWQLKILHN